MLYCDIQKPGYVSGPTSAKQLKQITNKDPTVSKQGNSINFTSVLSQKLQQNSNCRIMINCKYCQSVLKLRQKHCRQCDRCVSTFDHHCPFFNNCIGQFNKPVFYLFLLIQTIQIVINLWHVMENQIQNRTQTGIFVFSALLILGFLSATLLTYHTWLMAVNATTWEVLRAQKIWYINPHVSIQEEQENNQHQNNQIDTNINPQVFNQNILINIAMYWKAICRSEAIDWGPYYKPNPITIVNY